MSTLFVHPIWLRKTKSTKPNQKPNQTNCPKPLGLSYFCELRLHTKFQLPRLCLSCIFMVEEKKEEEKISFRGYLSSNRVELRLSLSWAKADQNLHTD